MDGKKIYDFWGLSERAYPENPVLHDLNEVAEYILYRICQHDQFSVNFTADFQLDYAPGAGGWETIGSMVRTIYPFNFSTDLVDGLHARGNSANGV